MNAMAQPKEVLIAEYTLGLLEPHELAQAHALLSEDDDAVALALHWESRLIDLVDILPPASPPAELWSQIQSALGHAQPGVGAAFNAPATTTAATRNNSTAGRPAVRPSPFTEASQKFLLRPDTETVPAHEQANTTACMQGAETPQLARAAVRPVQRKEADNSRSGPANPATPAPSPAKNTAAHSVAEDRAPIASASTRETRARDKPAHNAPEPRAHGPTAWLNRLTWNNVWFWRLLCAVLAAFTLVSVFGTSPRKSAAALAAPLFPAVEPGPVISQVAILQAPGQTSTPGWMLTVDSRQHVQLTPKVDIEIAPTAAVYLWTYNTIERRPRLLGIVDAGQPLTLSADVVGPVQPGQIFEMTLESNQFPPQRPDGPILFIGRTVLLKP